MACDHQWEVKFRVFETALVCRECGAKRRAWGSTLCWILALVLHYCIWPEIAAAMATSFSPLLQSHITQIAAAVLLLLLFQVLLSGIQWGFVRLTLKKRGRVPEA